MNKKPYKNEMEQAKALIDAYCWSAYHEHADFSDLAHIGVGYTEHEENSNVVIECFLSLENNTITYMADGCIVRKRSYFSLNDFISEELAHLSDFAFSETNELACEDLDRLAELSQEHQKERRG